jgi:hypothetical protein
MATLPSKILQMTLKPPRAGAKYRGTITLKNTSGQNQVEITLASGGSGTANVTYSESSANRGEIAAFALTVAASSGPVIFTFGGIEVFDPNEEETTVHSGSLTINGDSFEMSGVPDNVRARPAVLLPVRLAGNMKTVGLLRMTGIVKFFPIPVNPRTGITCKVTGNAIEWTYGGYDYKGIRFLFGEEDTPLGKSPSHGFLGIRTHPIHDDEDEWEASSKGGPGVLRFGENPSERSFPFPSQSFRMILSPPPSNRVSVSGGLILGGVIRLSFVDGKPAITIQSGLSPAVTTGVTYGAARPHHGVIGPFSVVIDGTEWNFGELTVFSTAGKTYLVSYQLTVGDSEYNLSGFPLPIKPFRGFFKVVRGGREVGTLDVDSDTAGSFKPAGGGPSVEVHIQDQTINWKECGSVNSGFPFILGVKSTTKGVTAEVGFLGTTVTVPEDEDDWEASNKGGPDIIDGVRAAEVAQE